MFVFAFTFCLYFRLYLFPLTVYLCLSLRLLFVSTLNCVFSLLLFTCVCLCFYFCLCLLWTVSFPSYCLFVFVSAFTFRVYFEQSLFPPNFYMCLSLRVFFFCVCLLTTVSFPSNCVLVFVFAFTFCHYFRLCPFRWGRSMHWLHLCRGVRPPPTSILVWP